MEIKGQTEANLKKLMEIRDNLETPPAVCIQAIQTMQKIIENSGSASTNARPTENEIMELIRKNARK